MSAEFSDKVHTLDLRELGVDIPARLNDPFDYVPHPLCKHAAEMVVGHILTHPEWSVELAEGKMFGVAIVRTPDGRVGFLAAFSGNLAGRNDHDYFVPPVYDMLAPDGFFRRGEAAISELNRTIARMEASPERKAALEALGKAETEARNRLDAFAAKAAKAKAQRRLRRASAASADMLDGIDNESRREKSELRRLKEECRHAVEAAKESVGRIDSAVAELKAERRRLSEALQRELFEHFVIVGMNGGKRNLNEIFSGMPPAGAGECAAPKLYQYALTRSLEVLATAEFWYGASPKGEVRRHGVFYPACRGKCKPILEFVLHGAELERPLRDMPQYEPKVIFEDNRIAVVDKPAGMLSVDGKIDGLSVDRWAKERYSEQARAVHRLDMATSGLLLIAKDSESYARLQEQFVRRTVRKRYVAVLEGDIAQDSGCIELPLRPDPHDRPRQAVDRQHGKPAVTLYTVRERRNGRTTVEFEPITGRTHQLRVHAASAEGLNTPIVGDTLYGAEAAERLCLHNEYLEFTHPESGRRMRFESAPEQEFFNL